MARESLVDPLPKGDEPEDLFGLLPLPQVRVGVAERPALGILGEKDEDAGLATAARRDIVALDDRMLRNRGRSGSRG